MEINILDTHQLYREMFALPDSKRGIFFENTFVKPFSHMFEKLGIPLNSDIFGGLPLSGKDSFAQAMLDKLKANDAWNKAEKTLESAISHFKESSLKFPEELLRGIFLGDPAKHVQSEGYTGIGSIPGYIQIVVASNDYNLPKKSIHNGSNKIIYQWRRHY